MTKNNLKVVKSTKDKELENKEKNKEQAKLLNSWFLTLRSNFIYPAQPEPYHKSSAHLA